MTEQDLLLDSVRRLNASGILYMLTGSMASNAWDVPLDDARPGFCRPTSSVPNSQLGERLRALRLGSGRGIDPVGIQAPASIQCDPCAIRFESRFLDVEAGAVLSRRCSHGEFGRSNPFRGSLGQPGPIRALGQRNKGAPPSASVRSGFQPSVHLNVSVSERNASPKIVLHPRRIRPSNLTHCDDKRGSFKASERAHINEKKFIGGSAKT